MSEDSEAQQVWDPRRYALDAGFVPVLGRAALDLLAPQPGERILDLGCGDGALTREIADRGARVVGLDRSAELLAAARARGLDVREGDGEALDFSAEFDAVFSNAALHWMKDAGAVARGVARALRPGGRFVGEFGGFGNVAAIATACRAVLLLRGASDGGSVQPWYFPTPEAYRAVLSEAGFRVSSIELFSRPTPLPTDIAGWLETMGGPFWARLPKRDRGEAIARTAELLEPALRDEEGVWIADYVRLRFSASLDR